MNIKSEEYPERYHKRWWEGMISRVSIPERNRILIRKRRTESDKIRMVVDSSLTFEEAHREAVDKVKTRKKGVRNHE